MAAAWSMWGAWSTWSTTCGSGAASKSRLCSYPPGLEPSCHGAFCIGSNTTSKSRSAASATNGAWVITRSMSLLYCLVYPSVSHFGRQAGAGGAPPAVPACKHDHARCRRPVVVALRALARMSPKDTLAVVSFDVYDVYDVLVLTDFLS